jgi:arylsulfatase A-like enzyme
MTCLQRIAWTLWIVGFASAAALFSPPRTLLAEDANRPNVLFLLTDDQRADTIAALGNPAIKTPHLDRLAQSGFVFRNAYCMGSTMGAVCNPSRHMLHSGMSLFRYDPKKKADTTGDVFRRAGYETFHLSKLGNTPHLYHTAFEHSAYLDDQRERTSGEHGKTAADETIKFLQNRKADRPFFVYLGFAGPHDPRVASARWLDLYQRPEIPLPKNYRTYHPFNNGELLVRDEKLAPWPRTEEIVRKHLHDYYGCISSIDANIGRIFRTLEELGEWENTIVVFSSDHGLAIGSHGLFGKQSVYEHSMKSPLIFSGPGIQPGNSDALVYLFDILPTLCGLTATEIPQGLDGKNLAPLIHGEEQSVRDSLLLAYRDVQRAIRKGDWKLIRYPQVDVTQLFNLKDDPAELNSLADDPDFAAKRDELLELLRQQQAAYNDPSPLSVAQPAVAEVDLAYFREAGEKQSNKKAKNKKKEKNDAASQDKGAASQ